MLYHTQKQTNYVQFIVNLYTFRLHTKYTYTYPALSSIFNMGTFYQRNFQEENMTNVQNCNRSKAKFIEQLSLETPK